MKLLTKTGSVIIVHTPIWMPQQAILKHLETKHVPDYVVPEGAAVFVMDAKPADPSSSLTNLTECMRFLAHEFGEPDHDEAEFFMTRHLNVGYNDFVAIQWTRVQHYAPSYGLLADTIVRRRHNVVLKDKTLGMDLNIAATFNMNFEAILDALDNPMGRMAQFPVANISGSRVELQRATDIAVKHSLGLRHLPALLHMQNFVDFGD